MLASVVIHSPYHVLSCLPLYLALSMRPLNDEGRKLLIYGETGRWSSAVAREADGRVDLVSMGTEKQQSTVL
ncbi:hypothetical protein Tcan_16733 [Toxocara canis]|uniref:Uncharacterized protein n=1 Tax=Toxocara canis TaxID=6265 RepID=A0A0B2V6X5_TOXCA|nr:hypothetical protein Tcan_16733 [Toxocara canis]